MAEVASPALELWGGIECTVNRVRDAFHDQIELSGHDQRADDLDRFAALGLRTLRYPILWERTAPHGVSSADWTWSDERLGRLRRLGIRPIIGLLHHGSGPRYTSLTDPRFPERLAAFARAVAERYPWVDAYTPVNEPLTTARFSGLYGHWYPHARDGAAFARALLLQCRGIAAAMRAIREVNPRAFLLQTEDIGETFSTPALRYQAAFENERRWLTFDLLCGRVDSTHPMWGYLRWLGASEHEILALTAEPCSPHLLGINSYVTSQRFLDERRHLYPCATHGGNSRETYADVEAVRVRAQGLRPLHDLLAVASERYRLPLVVSEAHLGCTREEQLRWLASVWGSAHRARRKGVDVRAVAAWSLLGTWDWHNLVTRRDGHYESGAFDARTAPPRRTAVGVMVAALASGRRYDHAVLDTPGWWERKERLLYPAVGGQSRAAPRRASSRTRRRDILVTGAAGTLGRALAFACRARGIAVRLFEHRTLDITDPDAVAAALDAVRPWAVINAAGYVRVDDAEREPSVCWAVNAAAPARLAQACALRRIRFVAFSSDLVFDGSRGSPYREDDPVGPVNVYGRSKVDAEARVREADQDALVVRTSAFFGPMDNANFVTSCLAALCSGRVFDACADETVSPTYIPDLAHATLDLLIDGARGIWHVANPGEVTWADLARQAAALAGVDPARVVARRAAELGRAAARPPYSALGTARGLILPTLADALARYMESRRISPPPS